MSQQQAAYLCDQARTGIDAAIGQGWALSFPSAEATLLVVANYLSAAANEIGGGAIGAQLQDLAGQVAAKSNEIIAFTAIPWPFVYAAIGPWANALNTIKSNIPQIAADAQRTLPAPTSMAAIAPIARPSSFAFGFDGFRTAALHVGKGPKGYRRSDERIREDVCDALTLHPFIDASDLEVSVSNGQVTLKGRIDGRQAKRAAEDCALAVLGVVDVQNSIQPTLDAQKVSHAGNGGPTAAMT